MISVFLAVSSVLGVYDYQDAFAYPNGSDAAPAWQLESVAWEVNDSTLTHSGGDRSFAILDTSPHALYATVEATVIVRERQGDEWNVAGVALRRDARNFWHIALVEAPEAQGRRHFVEVAEMLNGQWPAQGNLTAAAQEGSDFDWQYGRPYRLRLTLKQGRIEGSVAEMDGTQRANLAFLLDNTAVAAGQPALDCGGFNAAFDDVAVHIEQTAAAPEVGRESFPAYNVPGCANITADATGFFYPKEINGRWWLIDPNGQAFYMVGADHISYQVHWCQKLGYAPYARNMEAKYGSEEKWADHVAGQLADWNFNTLPGNLSRRLPRHRTRHATQERSCEGKMNGTGHVEGV